MSTPEPLDPAPAKAEVTVKLSLGDGRGDNKTCADALPTVGEQLDRGAPGGDRYRIIEWLSLCKDPFVWCAVNIPRAFLWMADRFTNRQLALMEKEAEVNLKNAQAEAVRKKAEDDSRKAKAEAKKVEAETQVALAKGMAEAHALEAEAGAKQVETDRKKHELQVKKKAERTAAERAKELRARGLDWATDLGEDGVLRIGVRKRKPPEGDDPLKELPPSS